MAIKIATFIKLVTNQGILKRNAATKCFPHHVKEAKECKIYFKKINIVNIIIKQTFIKNLFLSFNSIFTKIIFKM